MKFVELRTDRSILRAFRNGDLPFIFDHFSDPHVSEFLYDHEPPASIDDAKKILDWCLDHSSGDHLRWCVVLPNDGDTVTGNGDVDAEGDGEQIGTCGFHNIDTTNHSAEIGYDLSDRYRGRGHMTRALEVMLPFGFEELRLNRMYAYVYPMNTPSIDLLKKLGFICEGIVRDKHLYRGKYYDHALYSLLKREWGAHPNER